MDQSHPVEDVVLTVAHRDWLARTPTTNTWNGRWDRRRKDEARVRLWIEGPMPMHELEALLLRRLKDD